MITISIIQDMDRGKPGHVATASAVDDIRGEHADGDF
jgi:hypothetical protein